MGVRRAPNNYRTRVWPLLTSIHKYAATKTILHFLTLWAPFLEKNIFKQWQRYAKSISMLPGSYYQVFGEKGVREALHKYKNSMAAY